MSDTPKPDLRPHPDDVSGNIYSLIPERGDPVIYPTETINAMNLILAENEKLKRELAEVNEKLWQATNFQEVLKLIHQEELAKAQAKSEERKKVMEVVSASYVSCPICKRLKVAKTCSCAWARAMED